MNISTDIGAASNGVYQPRIRQTGLQGPEAHKSRAETPIPRGQDRVQFSQMAAEAARHERPAIKSPGSSPPVLSSSGTTTRPESDSFGPSPSKGAPSASQSNDAPASYTQTDLDALLSLFGQSYDLADPEGADPQVVQYDLNGDGIINSDDLGEMLGLFSSPE
ncbi:MAG: hypothetical protein ACTS3F_14905 [Phycisphaerales bacterium]